MSDDQPSAEDKSQIQQILRELAAEVLRQEQATPGQDPEYVRWATNTVNGGGAAAPAPMPPVASVQPQTPQPESPSVAESGEEGVLQIRQTPGQTIKPTEGTNRPDNGQGAAQ